MQVSNGLKTLLAKINYQYMATYYTPVSSDNEPTLELSSMYEKLNVSEKLLNLQYERFCASLFLSGQRMMSHTCFVHIGL